MAEDTEQAPVSWGKMIAGAAIAAGAVAVIAFFPGAADKVGDTLKTVIGGLWNGAGTLGEWISERISQMADLMAEHKAMAIGTAAGAGALMARRRPDPAPQYAGREELRQADARMQSAMRAQGFNPDAEIALT